MGQANSVNVIITFRNTESTEAIKNHCTAKVQSCLKKYIHDNTEAHVVLTVEKNRQKAEISFHVDGASFSCSEESDDLYASIDAMTSSLSSQLRKHKEKLTNHH